MRSRVSIMILRGERSLPVWLAGHSLVQRPHSVQVYASISCFQLRSGASLAPNLTGAASASGAGAAKGSALGSIIKSTSFFTAAMLSMAPCAVKSL